MEGRVTIRKIIAFCLFLFAPSTLLATTANEIENIKSLYARTNKTIEDSKTKLIFYYNTNSGWKTTNNPKAIGFKDVGEDRMLEQAHIYSYNDRVLKAVMFIDTPSGDWANKREYYFYDTGKTAFLLETHFTFLGHDYETQKPLPKGPYIIERRVYFGSSGKEIRRLERALTSKSKEPVPIRFLQQIDPDIYTDVSRLPSAREN
jgi:hypothetical protein